VRVGPKPAMRFLVANCEDEKKRKKKQKKSRKIAEK
jgi:hypothetical protein